MFKKIGGKKTPQQQKEIKYTGRGLNSAHFYAINW